MRTRSKLVLAALVAALTLAAATGGAAATRLGVNDQDFVFTWRNFAVPIGGGAETRCPLTLAGRFHSTALAKVRGLLVGSVTSAQLGSFTEGGRVTLLSATVPWHLTYQEFSGVLPSISRFRLALIGMSIAIFVPSLGLECLVRTEAGQPELLDVELESRGTATSVRVAETAQIACNLGIRWVFGGSGTAEVGGGRALVVTLV
jgi:hypothetical protein